MSVGGLNKNKNKCYQKLNKLPKNLKTINVASTKDKETKSKIKLQI